MRTRKNFLRPELKLHFAGPLGMKIEPWKFPTNIIGESLGSITLARGFEPLLARVPALRDLSSDSLPNEAIVWAMPGQPPFVTAGVAPVKDAKNYLVRIAPGLISLINSNLRAQNAAGNAMLTTNMSVAIRGLAILAPFLRATNDSGTDYLLGGIFAVPPVSNPFPWNSLYNTVSADNVIYYARGELNGDRMSQLDHFGPALFHREVENNAEDRHTRTEMDGGRQIKIGRLQDGGDAFGTGRKSRW